MVIQRKSAKKYKFWYITYIFFGKGHQKTFLRMQILYSLDMFLLFFFRPSNIHFSSYYNIIYFNNHCYSNS